MKKLITATACMLSAGFTLAQSVGVGTVAPNSSAVPDVSSTSKGLLIPRMDSASRIAITSPAKGLMVLDTSYNVLYRYNGKVWSRYFSSQVQSLSISSGMVAWDYERGDLALLVRIADIKIDTLNRVQRIQNTSIKGGVPYVYEATGVDIKPGSDTIKVHDAKFSFYDFTDYVSKRTNFRQPWICVPRYPYSSNSQQGDTSTVYWTQVNRVLNDSTAIMDMVARPGQFYIISGRISASTGSTIVMGDANTNFLFELYPGDELYSFDLTIGYIYLGTVSSIQSATQLTLLANATVTATNIPARTPATALFFPPQYPFFNYNYTTYLLHVVRWPVSRGTLYTKRAGGNDVTFNSLYISGNVATDNSNCYFQPLRQSRRCAADCGFPFTFCGACLVRDVNITKINNQNWYPVAGELKIFQQGPGFGFAVSSAENYETLPSKQ